MSWLSKLRWMKENEPDIFNTAAYFIGIKEYMIYQLSGQLVIDYSTASSTGIFESKDKIWYDKALDWCGITAVRLPEAVPSDTVLQSLPEVFGKSIKIIPGLSDGCAANLGAASLEKSDVTLTAGTSGAVRFTDKQRKTDPKGTLFSYSLDNELFVTGGASNNCFNVIEPIAQQYGIDPWKISSQELLDAQAAFSNLYYLPWRFGERSPMKITDRSDRFVNLTEQFNGIQLFKAGIEGVLFNLRMIYDLLSILNGSSFDRIHLSGGLSTIPTMNELISSIFNTTVYEHYYQETSALGIAFFTAISVGFEKTYDNIKKWNPVTKEHKPNKELSDKYAKAYKEFALFVNSFNESLLTK